VRRWLLDQLGDDHLAWLRLAAHVRRDEDVLADALVLGDQVPDTSFLVDAADDFAIRALDHVDDRAFRASTLVDADHAHGRAVAVQRLVHFLGTEKDVRSAVIRNQEAESVRVTLHLAGDQIELGDHAKLALAVGHQLSFAGHGREAALESFALRVALDRERLRELVGSHRYAALAQHIEDLLAAGNVDVSRLASRPARNSGRRGG